MYNNTPSWGLGAMETFSACLLMLIDSKDPVPGTGPGMDGWENRLHGREELKWVAEPAILRAREREP